MAGAGCVGTRTSGSEGGGGETDGRNGRPAPRRRPYAGPKTAASETHVPLTYLCGRPAAGHRRLQPEERAAAGHATTDALLFVTPKGWAVMAPGKPNTSRRFLQAGGVPKMTLHDLRSAAATLLVAPGVLPRVANNCSVMRVRGQRWTSMRGSAMASNGRRLRHSRKRWLLGDTRL